MQSRPLRAGLAALALPILFAFGTDEHELVVATAIQDQVLAPEAAQIVDRGNAWVDMHPPVSGDDLAWVIQGFAEAKALRDAGAGMPKILEALGPAIADAKTLKANTRGGYQCPARWHSDDDLIREGLDTSSGAFATTAKCDGETIAVRKHIRALWERVSARKPAAPPYDCDTTRANCVVRERDLMPLAQDTTRHWGAYLHTVQDFYSHTNWCELQGCPTDAATRSLLDPRTGKPWSGDRSLLHQYQTVCALAGVERGEQADATLQAEIVAAGLPSWLGAAMVAPTGNHGAGIRSGWYFPEEMAAVTIPSTLGLDVNPTALAMVSALGGSKIAATGRGGACPSGDEVAILVGGDPMGIYLHSGLPLRAFDGTASAVCGLNKDIDHSNRVAGGGACATNGYTCAISLAKARQKEENQKLCEAVKSVVIGGGGTPEDVTAVWYFITGTEVCGCAPPPERRYYASETYR